MSTMLPTNLAAVGDDLARATSIDARRSLKRRRLATLAVAFALLALLATTAVANGWLFGSSSTIGAAPDLQANGNAAPAPKEARSAADQMSQSEARHQAANRDPSLPAVGTVARDDSRVLLADLGASHRTLSSVITTSGGACIALSGFAIQCPPVFAAGQQVIYFNASPPGGPTVIWGVARDEVERIEAVAADGRSTRAHLANDAFFVELDEPPTRLIVHLEDGRSSAVVLLSCPPTTPTCTP